MKILSGLLFIILVLAAGQYPRLFSRLGTPLYEADRILTGATFSKPLQDKTALYHEEAKKTLQLGRDIENAELPEMETIQFYHTSLRMLNKNYNEILVLLKNELRTAISQDDYQGFKRIVDLHLDALFEQESVKRQAVSYYKDHKAARKDPYMENLADDLKQMEIYEARAPRPANNTPEQGSSYKPLIMLTASWCPACKRAKTYMREHRIIFQEYDIERSSYGKKLYKERNGFAVPMLIIGDEHKTGFDLKWIKKHQ